MSKQDALFDIQPENPTPLMRIIILTGPSGSGKTSLTSRLGLPSLSLDNFYKDDTDPNLPRLPGGKINWDNPASWKFQEALDTLTDICVAGQAEVPIYDIPSNSKTGTFQFSAGNHTVLVVEGIFASTLVAPLQERGLLLGAVCIARSPWRNAWFRLLRDLGEARKPIPTLLWRGAVLLRREPKKVRTWLADGCEPARSIGAAERRIRQIVAA